MSKLKREEDCINISVSIFWQIRPGAGRQALAHLLRMETEFAQGASSVCLEGELPTLTDTRRPRKATPHSKQLSSEFDVLGSCTVIPGSML